MSIAPLALKCILQTYTDWLSILWCTSCIYEPACTYLNASRAPCTIRFCGLIRNTTLSVVFTVSSNFGQGNLSNLVTPNSFRQYYIDKYPVPVADLTLMKENSTTRFRSERISSSRISHYCNVTFRCATKTAGRCYTLFWEQLARQSLKSLLAASLTWARLILPPDKWEPSAAADAIEALPQIHSRMTILIL